MDSKRALKNTKINKQNKNKISFIFSFFLFIYSLYCCTCVFIQRKNKIIIENGIRIYYQHKLKYSIQIKYPKTVSSRKRCNKNFFFPPAPPFRVGLFYFFFFFFLLFLSLTPFFTISIFTSSPFYSGFSAFSTSSTTSSLF